MALWTNTDNDAGKPKFLSEEDKQNTFGVSVATGEMYAGIYAITDVAIVQGGLNYTEAPSVSFDGDGGGATATTTITNGVVTAIEVTSTGSYYDVPNVFIDVPRRTVATGDINTTTDVIGYESHLLETGDALIYRANGGAAIGGLTNNVTYYVHTLDEGTFKLYDTRQHAIGGGVLGLKNLTDGGNDGQYFDLVAPNGVTATAKAVKGIGQDQNDPNQGEYAIGEQHVTHSGWVKKTVGTGGRAGRVFYETLVASGSMLGDAADDIQFPDD